MTYQVPSNSSIIAQLNDAFRQSLADPNTRSTLGIIRFTSQVQCQPPNVQQEILQAIAQFDRFTEGNDPYTEYDFGAIEHPVVGAVWFKIDYYDRALEKGSSDPTNPAITRRVMTIMLPEEY